MKGNQTPCPAVDYTIAVPCQLHPFVCFIAAGLGLAVLGVGLVIRSLVAFLAVFGAGLNMKEKFFIPLAWLPKATVQAAIGSVALDTAKEKNLGATNINLGVQVRIANGLLF